MMTEKPEDLKDSLPTERKHVWRSAEERRMSDLTRVLEWLERRQRKKTQSLQVPFQVSGQNAKDEETSALYRRLYRVEAKGKRLSMALGNYPKDMPRKSDVDIKDVITQESTQRSMPYHRQSTTEPTLQDAIFPQRRATLFRDWVGKMSDISYERKLKSLMEKGVEPKVEMVRMLKPEEVLSCRYLRLSKNNIRTLLKLCKDAGMNVDIHPHMVEGEIDAKKVFNQNTSVAL
nr:uncharacterized protein C16orf78 homolog [Camelus bactrianus]